MNASNKSERSEKLNRAYNDGWSFSRPTTSACPIDAVRTTPTRIFYPDSTLPPTNEDISGSCALTDPDDLGVYLIRACGLVPSFCPIPGIGLGGLAPSSCITPSLALGGYHNPMLQSWVGYPCRATTSERITPHSRQLTWSAPSTVRPGHPPGPLTLYTRWRILGSHLQDARVAKPHSWQA